MNVNLLQGLFLIIFGFILFFFILFKCNYEKKQKIENEYQSVKNIIGFVFSIIMIIYGLNILLDSI